MFDQLDQGSKKKQQKQKQNKNQKGGKRLEIIKCSGSGRPSMGRTGLVGVGRGLGGRVRSSLSSWRCRIPNVHET